MKSPNVCLILLMLKVSWKVMSEAMITFANKKIKNMSRLSEHNKEIKDSAEYRAGEMRTWPSPLEERMKVFLDRHYIRYEFQKIFYIYGKDGWILRYYIADFFLPGSNIIIEVDGKFHDKHRQHDKDRTKAIQEHYPDVKVLRYTWKDLSDEDKMRNLLLRLDYA